MSLLSQTKLPAKLENLAAFLDPVKDCAEEQGITHKRIMQIELAAEEILVNIFNYAYQEEENGYARVTCRLEADNRFVIEFEDAGIPFNALSLNEPDLTSEIPDRQIGGLGVFLVKELMDDVQYRREDARNILEISVLIA